MVTIYPDVSEYQPVVDDNFNREILAFRVSNEWGNLDKKVTPNLQWAKTRRSSGKIKQFVGYVNPCNVPNIDHLNNLDAVGFPNDAVIMMDLESWGGLVGGNHTVDVNALAASLRARQGDRADLVWIYANQGDLNSLYPGPRLSWLKIVVAGYQQTQPNVSNMIAWQYTNGTENYTSWPMRTLPFGNCDHNALFVPIPLPGGIDMPLTADDIKAIWAYQQAHTDSTGKADTSPHAMSFWLTDAQQQAAQAATVKPPTADQIATAVVAKLPPTNTGGLTVEQVKTAVKAALAEGTATP